MLAAAARTRDLEGSPRVEMTTPEQFFLAAHDEYTDAPVWSGEMYLEFHRGTYTSQANTKRGNRRSAHLLREAELWATTATVRLGAKYPYDLLDTAWKTVLLQQFHDILPGTSIAWVHQEAERRYAEVAETVNGQIARSLGLLAGDGGQTIAFNAAPHAREGVPGLGGAAPRRSPSDRVVEAGAALVLENEIVRVTVDGRGLIVSLRDLRSDREVIPPGETANPLQLFRDAPIQWDAWDIDESYQRVGEDLTSASEVAATADGHGIRIVRSFGESAVVQELRLNGATGALVIHTAVDWHETQKLLKLAFPLDVHADRAASEMQFGHVFRPTHVNTSWDAARFETVAHRWVHVGEPGYGVAVANDASYGHDIRRSARHGGGTATVVRVSLLRAPLFPDPDSDQGRHEFLLSLRVGAGISEAIDEGYRLNLPLREARGSGSVVPLVAVGPAAIVVEAVKLAEDRSGDVIVRLYESLGGRTRGPIEPRFPWSSVTEVDILERPRTAEAVVGQWETSIAFSLRPFQIVTLRLARVP